MSKISHFAADHPAIVSILLITVLLFGGISLMGLNTSLMADLSLPQIYIISIYPGASPEDVENDVSKVIEDELAVVPGLKNINSTSGGSLSIVTLVFQDGIDPEDKIADVRYRVDMLKEDLPAGLQGEPMVLIGDSSMLPVMTFTISNEDTERAYDYLKNKIIPRITKLSGVSGVTIVPDGSKTIKVRLRLDDLAEKNISPVAVYQVLQAGNTSYPLGETTYKDRGVGFRYNGNYESIEDIENMLVGQNDGVLVRLKDVADVISEAKEDLNNVKVNGKNAFYVEVQKRSDGDVVTICREVKKILEDVDNETGGALNYAIQQDDSVTTNNSINSVLSSGIMGAIMAVFAIWLCLADPKATLIIGITIPLCVIISIILLAVSGRSINIMTTSGMVVALGMVVDGSIVMLEQVYRYIGTGKYNTRQAIYRGSDEVASSILGSVLTTIVVFVPIITLKGIVGIILSDVALTLMYSMIASLIVSVVVIPFLIKVLRKDGDKVPQHRIVNKAFEKMEKGYKAILSWCINNRKYVLIVSIFLLVISVLFIPMLGVSFIPSLDQSNFYINCKLPYTYTDVQTHREAKLIEDYLNREYAGIIDNYIATITVSSEILEQGGRNKLTYHVVFKTKDEVKREDIHYYIKKVQSDLNSMIPDGEITVKNGGFDNLLGYVSDGGGWGVTLSGEDMDELYATSLRLKEHLEKHPEVMGATLSTTYDNSDVIFNINHDSISSLGATSMEAGLDALLLFRDTDVGKFSSTSGDRYNITITSDASDMPLTRETLSSLDVKSLTGEYVNFDTLGDLLEEKSLTSIDRKNRSRTISIKANLISTNTANVQRYMDEYIAENPLPDGVSEEAGGIMELLGDSIGPLMQAALIAIFLVYVVMVIQFERYRQPLLIMGCIPFSLIGIILALVVYKTEFSIVVVLALVALSGTVVNNGIILIDYTNMERYKRRECKAKGLDESVLDDVECDITGTEYRDVYLDKEWELKTLRETVVGSAASRIKPILMTVSTTLLGVIPMAYSKGEGSELMAPMGQCMFLGLLVSTVVALVTIPILYYMTEAHVIKSKTKKGDNMKKKRVHLTAIGAIFSILTLVGCSYNFDAGVSGSVYEIDDKTAYPNVYVYAYTSESERDADYNRWLNLQNSDKDAEEHDKKYGGLDDKGDPVKDTAPFRPNPDYNVFSTQTATDGSFTVSKIVWSTSTPIWGRDNDRTKLYMMYFNKDAKLLKDPEVYSVVSGSNNQAKIRANLKRCFVTFPGVAGHIRDKSKVDASTETDIDNREQGRDLDDGRKIALYVYDANVKAKTPSEWPGDPISTVTTKSTETSSTNQDKVYYTHGNYSRLGVNQRLKLIYDNSSDSGYILYYIKDASDDISEPSGKEDMYNSRRCSVILKYTTDGTGDSESQFDRSKTSGNSALSASKPEIPSIE